ncbi:MAG TPA: [FeFe] hydrogenase, group A [Bacillota bacterium]|nr:[FeFe] hydrogenase, group A [Bacillota bacterium]
MKGEFVVIDGRSIELNGEKNLLEVARKAGIDIPTFCYHSQLSVYGACRLCIVDIEGRGVVTSCSTAPEPGMKVRTNTDEIRAIRKVAVELLLANHDQSCPTCSKSASCRLQSLARRFGIEQVRYKRVSQPQQLDKSSYSLVRDPNKCILCGDCVRACREVQGIGAIDFVGRGSHTSVQPAFGKDLKQVECVNCGLCASVCPTGAIIPKPELEGVWKAVNDPKKKVIAQIAPAVRVAVGEMFGLAPGTIATGQIVAALRMIGFDAVYDTSFTADLTVIEEGMEFLNRKTKGERLPQFTSCCPGWVKYAEQYATDMLPNLSSCKSPQQMFGSLAKHVLPETFGISKEDLVVVSIMPCTAKKFEAKRPEFIVDGVADVDFVLTTQELGLMIEEAGLDFESIEPESMDMPFGQKTGAGVIFGATGGVTEAVLRFAAEKLGAPKYAPVEYRQVRGGDGLREATLTVNGVELKLAIVYGLGNAQKVLDDIRSGKCKYDLVEVMSCPGGCVGGAGQPVSKYGDASARRAKGLYDSDKMLDTRRSQDNAAVADTYKDTLGEVGSKLAHDLLHTKYKSRKRLSDFDMELLSGTGKKKLDVKVCVGTSCMIRGSQHLLQGLMEHIEDRRMSSCVDIKATFCFEACDLGPTVSIGGKVIRKCTMQQALDTLDEELSAMGAVAD